MVLDMLVSLDKFISEFIYSNLNSSLVSIFTFITHLADTITIIFFSSLILFYFYKKKEKFKINFFLHTMIIGTIIFSIIKLLTQRLRPEERLMEYITYSFPSGHTTMSTILALNIYFLFKKKIVKSKFKILILFGLILFPILIGVSRIYLNVHWFSDVIVGWVLGFAVVWYFKRSILLKRIK